MVQCFVSYRINNRIGVDVNNQLLVFMQRKIRRWFLASVQMF